MTKKIHDCYKCKHRGTVPGDAHSKCHHPVTKEIHDDPILSLMGMAAITHLELVDSKRVLDVAVKNGIMVDTHGFQNGWCNWPANFDPVWIKKCEGYESKD